MISSRDLAREIGARVAKFDPPAHARRLTAVLQIQGVLRWPPCPRPNL